MPPTQDDWSDSGSEDLAGLETNVLLGIPDGPVDDLNDVNDAAVSRIGGYPAFLPSREPPFHSSLCNVCHNPMQLLVQIWCPFEDSPTDRALYVWGCSRGTCQKRDGSVRAWRGLRFNEKYAAKLEKKLMKKRKRERAKAQLAAAKEVKQTTSKANPFSISAPKLVSPSDPLALGDQIFGGASIPAVASAPATEFEEDSGDQSDTSEQSLTIALASTTLEESPWKLAPSYVPLYLSTVSEYLPPSPKSKLPPNAHVTEPDPGNHSWNSEIYENSLQVDNVFDKFTQRVAHESEQCLRYELNGIPLPFAKDVIYDKLFPSPELDTTIISKAAFKVSQPVKRTYSPSPSTIPPCPACSTSRVFECQLMPNLINVLQAVDSQAQAQNQKKQSEEERRKAVERALKGGEGMSWGTCLIFSCEKDCCVSEDGVKQAKECWREEIVMVQWDS